MDLQDRLDDLVRIRYGHLVPDPLHHRGPELLGPQRPPGIFQELVRDNDAIRLPQHHVHRPDHPLPRLHVPPDDAPSALLLVDRAVPNARYERGDKPPVVRYLPVDHLRRRAPRASCEQPVAARGVHASAFQLALRAVRACCRHGVGIGLGLDGSRGLRAGPQPSCDYALDEPFREEAAGRVEESAFPGDVVGADQAAGGN